MWKSQGLIFPFSPGFGYCSQEPRFVPMSSPACPLSLPAIHPQPMQTEPLLLASASPARAQMLAAAGLAFTAAPARVDEEAIRAALTVAGAPPRDIADALAEAKARKLAARNPEALTLGCDQLLVHDGEILTKPETRAAAAAQLARLSGTAHELFSAAVLYQGAAPQWRHVARAKLTMHPLLPGFIEAYLGRAWPGIEGCVGGYKIEEEGICLFCAIDGEWHTILGLPLLPLLSYLTRRGTLQT